MILLDIPEQGKNVIEALAVIAAGGFFLWKANAGWLVVNLEIFIETERQFLNNEDILAFKIILKKGSTDTLKIKDVKARVYMLEEDKEIEVQPFSFPEITKLKVENYENIVWEKNQDNEKISLSPGESFHLGRHCKVPNNKPVIVEATLFGNRIFWKKGFQWRASVVSLPPKKEVKG